MKFWLVILFCISMVFPLGNSPWDVAASSEMRMESEKSDLNDSLLPFESELEETELFLLQIPGFIPPLLPIGRHLVTCRPFSCNSIIDAQGCRPPPSEV